MWQEIKALNEQRGQKLADMKAILKKAQDDNKRDLTAEEDTQFNTLNTEAEALKSQVERMSKLATLEQDLKGPDGEKRQQPGRDEVEGGDEKRQDEQATLARGQINAFLRFGQMPSAEMRAVTVSGMGIVGDRPMYDSLVEILKSYAGVRQAGAEILATGDGNPINVPRADDTSNTGQIVGEAATNNDAADPTLDTVELAPVKFDSKWIKVSTEMLQDNSFNLEAYILRAASERIGRAFNTYSTTGTGVAQPEGVLTGSTTGKVAAANNAITYEELLDLIHSIDAAYRNMPGFRLMFADTTLAAIRKLKDGDGRYIFAAGAAGAPSAVLDYQYVVNNDMPTLASGVNSKVVLGGDFSRYMVRDVTSPLVVRATELFIGDGMVGFRVFSRHDGKVIDSNAFKTLNLAAA